ncbi:MAG: hypothetical protein AAGI01_11555 [Myxococcota bacterium]
MADRKQVERLAELIDEQTQIYGFRFGGRPRATRSLDELHTVIANMEALIAEGQGLANGSDGGLLKDTLDRASENLKMYRAERERIEEAKEQEYGVEGAMLATWANCVFDEYVRHFAGKSRATRDVGRMREMIAELDALRVDMRIIYKKTQRESVGRDLANVEENLEMYREELGRIQTARDEGSRDDRASRLATAANEQFNIYNQQFAGKSRATRRPGLLLRVIDNLEDLFEEMRELNGSGRRIPQNTKNMGIIRRNVEMYQREQEQIEAARAGIASSEDSTLAGNLGGAANDVMAEYRENFAGRARETRDHELLASLSDQMYELALQMRDIQDAEPENESNNRNLMIVLDNLLMYGDEYRRILEAKGMG